MKKVFQFGNIRGTLRIRQFVDAAFRIWIGSISYHPRRYDDFAIDRVIPTANQPRLDAIFSVTSVRCS